jgi:hypothetical protein
MHVSVRAGLLATAGAVVVAVMVVVVFAVTATRSTSAPSQEDEVRAVLNGMNTSYNRSDFAGFAAHLCPDVLRAGGYEAGWYKSREADGPTQITVNSIDVAGDPAPHAVANVRFEAANHPDAKTLDVDFLREGGDWKACRFQPARAV